MSLSFFQQVSPKAGTPGVADPGPAPAGAQPQSPPGSTLTMLLPFLILVPFLFLSFRRQKKEQEARGKLKKDDMVVTGTGLIGQLVDVDEREGKVKIAPGTTVRVLASSLSAYTPAAEKAKTDKELADLKEAKATADKK